MSKEYCNSCGSQDCCKVAHRDTTVNPNTGNELIVHVEKTYCNKCGSLSTTPQQSRNNYAEKSDANHRDTYRFQLAS